MLGFESVGVSVTASSEFGLSADSLRLFVELHTESSERERPIKRDTLPDFAASIKVPEGMKEFSFCVVYLLKKKD